jgi:hypothetical protein
MGNEQGETTDLVLWTVAAGEAAGLVAAYREAEAMAVSLRAAFAASGIGPDVVTVAATVTDAGRPAVRVDLSPAGAVRLVASLDIDGHPPPRRRDGPVDPAGGRFRAA